MSCVFRWVFSSAEKSCTDPRNTQNCCLFLQVGAILRQWEDRIFALSMTHVICTSTIVNLPLLQNWFTLSAIIFTTNHEVVGFTVSQFNWLYETSSRIHTVVYFHTNFMFFLILCIILLHAFLCNYLALVYNFIFLHSKLATHSHNKSFSLFIFLYRIKSPSLRSSSSKIFV